MVRWCSQNSITKNVGVVVATIVDIVLMTPKIRKESESSNKIEYGLVNNTPWCFYTGAIFL
jgi:hypothetical protein